MSNQNFCGKCTVCCTAIPILEPLNKPENTDCTHLCKSGCSIYQKRPSVCVGFKCFALKMDEYAQQDANKTRRQKSAFRENISIPLRPDKLGILIYAGAEDNALIFRELEEGALEKEGVEYLIEQAREDHDYVLIRFKSGKRRILTNKLSDEEIENKFGKFKQTNKITKE